MSKRWTVLVPLTVALVLAGCGGSNNTDVASRLKELEEENGRLSDRVQQLTKDLRPLEKKLHEIEQMNRHLDKVIGQIDKDLSSRIHALIQQARDGRRQGFVRPAPAVPAPPPKPEKAKPYMGFDGQTITEELIRELKLAANSGVLVTAVREGAPGAIAGLQKDDVVQRFGEAAVRTKTELVAALAKREPGEVVVLAGVRGDGKFEVKLKLGRR